MINVLFINVRVDLRNDQSAQAKFGGSQLMPLGSLMEILSAATMLFLIGSAWQSPYRFIDFETFGPKRRRKVLIRVDFCIVDIDVIFICRQGDFELSSCTARNIEYLWWNHFIYYCD